MDYKVVIDAGHGGVDGGASGNGILEKDLTLRISEEMFKDFEKAGIPVKMTRITDETITPTERVNRILEAFGNNENVIVISNHINAGGGDGAEVIYALRNDSNLANLVSNNLKESGQNIRKIYQRRLPSNPSKDYYFIHRNTGITEPIIVEYGFLDSKLDDVNQLKNNYKNYAQAVTNAVLEYIGKQPTNTVTVKRGDSLYNIAQKYNTTVDAIKKLNNLTSNSLSVGQVLIIPDGKEDNYNYYIVRSGDTLYSIGKQFNLTVDELKRLNNLLGTTLSVGQQLIINGEEELPNDEQTYNVQSGDTLYSIARKFGLTVDELKEKNNLISNELSIGQILEVGNNEIELPTEEVSYIVQSGDNLYSIARKYNVSLDELMEYNNLKTNLLSIGQVIRIPGENINNVSNLYIVQSGDSLWSIAKKFDTTVDDIRDKNNLTSNLLFVGQNLII